MRRPGLIAAGLLAALLTSCAGYHLGPTNGQTAGARSVQLNPVVNRTLEPRLGDYLTTALRERLQQDATYRLATHGDGDVVLSGVILTYRRSEVSYQPSDVISVLDYDITLTAQITARERSTGRVLFDTPVTGRTTLQTGNDLPSAERQALPLLADEVARKAAGLLVDGTW